ncbi:ABC transporter permease [Devosia sp. J2-20]|uniref:ABC transporter permease n=1 Tax=Devosia sp. J2-20 TaxID=3026161 RepID=UPI00249AF9CE|nr:ABC transporter permease [Devosia sp. J2-20]WDQ98241.1 ABC transporter permease [Devosia sp. J2-20]
MIGFLLQRAFQAAIVMVVVAFLAFFLFRFAGDPVAQMVGAETSLVDQARIRQELGLNDPFPMQFMRFVGDIATGNFGFSFRTRQPIGEMLISRLPATIELGTVALLVSLLVGIPAGIYAAVRPDSAGSQALLITTLIGVSIPTFVIGIVLIFLFGVYLGWLPTFGRGETVEIGWWRSNLFTLDGWRSLVLPAITLGLYQLTLTMRLVRSEMMEVMRTDFIRFATARGIPYRSLLFRHALGNTMIPVVTIVGLQFGGVIAFSIVTESVFQWPGMGLLFLESIRYVDIPVMAVYLVVVALVFVLINLAVDVLYFAIDPRIRVRAAL